MASKATTANQKRKEKEKDYRVRLIENIKDIKVMVRIFLKEKHGKDDSEIEQLLATMTAPELFLLYTDHDLLDHIAVEYNKTSTLARKKITRTLRIDHLLNSGFVNNTESFGNEFISTFIPANKKIMFTQHPKYTLTQSKMYGYNSRQVLIARLFMEEAKKIQEKALREYRREYDKEPLPGQKRITNYFDKKVSPPTRRSPPRNVSSPTQRSSRSRSPSHGKTSSSLTRRYRSPPKP
jgi:hypothetical protein